MIRDMGFVLETPDGAPWKDEEENNPPAPSWALSDATGATGPSARRS